MRAVLLAAFAVLMSLVFVDPLHAAAQCGDYGKEAAKQAQRSDDLKCGFGGKGDARFWNDPKGHTRWCVGVTNETKNAERDARAHSLSKCEMCRAYSNQANAAAQESRTFRCREANGARWSSGDGGPNDGHFSWCMNQREHDAAGFYTINYSLADVKSSRLDPETNARAADLKACKATYYENFTEPELKRCRHYANDAMVKARFNVEAECGATPVGRWSHDEQEHLRWCLGLLNTEAGSKLIDSEMAFRERGTAACAHQGAKISADGTFIYKKMGFVRKPKPAAVDPDKMKTMMTPRAAGGDNTSTNPGTSKGTSTSGDRPFVTIRRPAGGDNTSTNPSTSKGSSTKSTSSSGGGGCGSSAMDRLGAGGGCGPGGGPAGGDNLSHSGGTPGTKSKPNTGASTSSGGSGAIGGGPSGGTPVAAPKSFGRSGGPSGGETLSQNPRPSGGGGGSIDYGFGPAAKPARPPK